MGTARMVVAKTKPLLLCDMHSSIHKCWIHLNRTPRKCTKGENASMALTMRHVPVTSTHY